MVALISLRQTVVSPSRSSLSSACRRISPRIAALSTLSSVEDPSQEAFLSRSEVEGEGGITFLNLNRKSAKNALSMKLVGQMKSVLDVVRYDETRVLIVRSVETGSFCSGADLKERKQMTMIQVNTFLHDLRQTFALLESLPMPTIAAIDGPALGGGLELALTCDLRVAGSNATKLGLTETSLGIIPGAGGTQRLTRLLGLSRTKSLVFSAKIINAQQALDLGLVDYVAENESAVEKATQLAREIIPNAPLAVRASKLAINRSLQLDMETGLDFERQCYNSILGSKDRLEGLAAFAEKRKPRYIGE